MDAPDELSAIFDKGARHCDFRIPLVHTKALHKMGLL